MKRPLFFISFLLSGLAAMLCLLYYKDYGLDRRQYEGNVITVIGTVRDVECRDNSNQTVTVSNLKIKTGSVGKNPNFITKLILRNPKVLCECTGEELKIGQTIAVTGSYANFKEARNPGEFDLGRYYFSKGILFQIKDAEIIRASEGYSYPGQFLWTIKSSIKSAFYDRLDVESAGVMMAMFLGDRTGLTKETKEEYNEAGIAHVLAISGLHISIIGAFLYLLLNRLPLKPAVKVGCLAGFLICYAAMVGPGVSIVRAMVCFLLRRIALLFGRSTDSLTNLGIASLITLIICPSMLISSSYLLSFLAVAGISLLSEEVLPRNFGMEHPWLQRLLSGFAIAFLTLPIIMDSYYSVPVYSIPLNLLILPFMPYLFGCGGGLLIFHYLGEAWKGLGGTMMDGVAMSGIQSFWQLGDSCWQGLCRMSAFLIQSILSVFRILNGISLSLPHGRIVTGARPLWRVLVFFILLFISVFLSGRMRKQIYLGYRRTEIYFRLDGREYVEERRRLRKQELRLYFLQVITVLCLLIFLFIPVPKGFHVTFLDVGQGDGILIENGRNTYVIDGGSTSKKKLGEYTLIPALKYRGIHKVDAWFVTHPDSDHISGLVEVIGDGEMEIDCIYVPSCMEGELRGKLGNRIRIKGLYEDEKLSDGSLSFTVLSPPADGLGSEANGSSLVLLMEKDGTRFLGSEKRGIQFLFMGDAGEEAEERIMRDGIRNVDVLKVGHHGSAVHTNGEEFLASINPRIAVISCGIKNRYGHPHEETLDRLIKTGAHIYRTDESGAVMVMVKGRKLVVDGYIE